MTTPPHVAGPFLDRLALRHLDATGRALDEGGVRCGDIRILTRRAGCLDTLRLQVSELRLDVLGAKPEVIDSGAVARTWRHRGLVDKQPDTSELEGLGGTELPRLTAQRLGKPTSHRDRVGGQHASMMET